MDFQKEYDNSRKKVTEETKKYIKKQVLVIGIIVSIFLFICSFPIMLNGLIIISIGYYLIIFIIIVLIFILPNIIINYMQNQENNDFVPNPYNVQKPRKPISNQLKHEIWRRDNFTCQYCRRDINEVVLEIDHIMPVSKGGTNSQSNLQTLCITCNRRKSNK